ncbi:type VII secretion protein EccB, partial [Actinocorallia lasiicapitis]
VGARLGGAPLAAGTGVVVASGKALWLVADGLRMELPKVLLRPLAAAYQPVQVPPLWLNGLAPGPRFRPPDIPGYGTRRASPFGGLARIGQTYTVAASGASPEQWFVLLREGLAPISKTEAWLLENSPRAANTVRLSRAAVNRVPAGARLPARGLPDVPPTVVPYDGTRPLCAEYPDPSEGRPVLTLDAALPPIADAAAVGSRPDRLDQVAMRPGTGVLAGVMQNAPNVAGYVLITEDGRRFPIATADDVVKLGYATDRALRIPSYLLQLLPEGPILDSKAAARQAG